MNRAANTHDYLTARGITGSRSTIDGRGSHEPLVANATPANHAPIEIFVAEAAPTH